MKYKYIVGDDNESLYDLDSDWDNTFVPWIAEDAAEDYHSNHDGWEDRWPLKFTIFKDGLAVGVCNVELEHKPHFDAYEVK